MTLRLGSETGSLMNHVMAGGTKLVPTVGMGVTVLGWTDRYPGTVILVSPSGKTINVQEDLAVRTDANGMSESQEYAYSPDPHGRIWTFRLGKHGWRGANKGPGLRLGVRERYYDYSF